MVQVAAWAHRQPVRGTMTSVTRNGADTPANRRRRTWPIAMVLAVAVAYALPLVDLLAVWNSYSRYHHGFLVPVFSAFLLWQRRPLLAAVTPQFDRRGLSLIGLALVLYVAGFAAGM